MPLKNSIQETPVHARYLMILNRVSDAGWAEERADVLRWAGATTSIDASEARRIRELVDRNLTPTEVALATVYCYADIPHGHRWQRVFRLDQPDACEPTLAVLQMGVAMRTQAAASLVAGWHQTAVVDFPNGPPPLIESLPVDERSMKAGPTVCLCADEDYPAIVADLKAG